MSLRLGMLLCLSGLAACSHDTPRTADDRSYASESSAASPEPPMKPASLEDSSGADDNPNPRRPAANAPRVSSDESRPNSTTTTVSPKATESPRTNEPSPGVPPDDTKVNERDRNAAALTPLDQRENETDLKISQQIRQAVMADKSLSFTAKNVKIITQGGKVTLRGPVNTEQERSAIEAAARKVAGATQVDNQLEVKK
jgi:hyperosmotically inducible periplasmic protein